MKHAISSFVIVCSLSFCAETYAFDLDHEYKQMLTNRKPTSELRAFLLEHPEFVNIGNDEKETALHLGIWNSDTSFVNFLISLEVDLNQLDRNNYPPLVYACGECNLEMIRLLLENGAKTKGVLHSALMNTCDPQFHQSDEMISELDSTYESGSWTPGRGKKTIPTKVLLGILFEYGADPNERGGGSGNTILHVLAELGNLKLIQFVISQNARTDLKNNDGSTPRDIALCWIGRASLSLEDFFPLFEKMANDQESENVVNPETVRKIKGFLKDYHAQKNSSMFGPTISFFVLLQQHGITNADFHEYGRCRAECTEQMKPKTHPKVEKRLKVHQALLVDTVTDSKGDTDIKSLVLIGIVVILFIASVIEQIKK